MKTPHGITHQAICILEREIIAQQERTIDEIEVVLNLFNKQEGFLSKLQNESAGALEMARQAFADTDNAYGILTDALRTIETKISELKALIAAHPYEERRCVFYNLAEPLETTFLKFQERLQGRLQVKEMAAALYARVKQAPLNT